MMMINDLVFFENDSITDSSDLFMVGGGYPVQNRRALAEGITTGGI